MRWIAIFIGHRLRGNAPASNLSFSLSQVLNCSYTRRNLRSRERKHSGPPLLQGVTTIMYMHKQFLVRGRGNDPTGKVSVSCLAFRHRVNERVLYFSSNVLHRTTAEVSMRSQPIEVICRFEPEIAPSFTLKRTETRIFRDSSRWSSSGKHLKPKGFITFLERAAAQRDRINLVAWAYTCAGVMRNGN